MDEARAAFQRRDYELAARLFGAVPAGQDRCDAVLYEGLSLQHLGRINSAIIALQAATSCSTTAAPQLALAEAWIAKGDDNRAAAALETALRAEPRNVAALRALSSLYLRHELNDKAAAILQGLIKEVPDDANAHADLGAAWAGLLDYSKAQGEFEKALMRDPAHTGALIGLANTFIKTSEAAKAIPLLNRAIQSRSSAYEAWYLRGMALNALQRPAEALEDFRHALKLAGEDADILYQLSRVYRALGRKAEASETLNRFSAVRRKSQANEETKREAARLLIEAGPLVERGQLSEAIGIVRKAVDLDPANPSNLFRLAGLLYDTRQYDEARATVARAIDLAPSEWKYYYLQGLIEADGNQLEAAQSSLETAVRLHPASADVHNALGTVAMRRRDTTLGLQSFEKAVALNPGEAAFRRNRDAAKAASGSR